MKRRDIPRSAKVLLVDENKLGCTARKAILVDHGYEVETACSGTEAGELFRTNNFDIVVTDLRLRDMGGVELIRRIRESNLPARAILLAGFLDSSGLTKKSTGADELIAKSDREVPELLRAVRRLAVRPRRRGPSSHQARNDPSGQARAV